MTQLPHHVGLQTRTQLPHHVGLQSRTLARLGSSTWADSSNTFGGGGTCQAERLCAEVGAVAPASAPAQRAAVARAASDSHPGRAPASRGDSGASERRTASESGVVRVRSEWKRSGKGGRSAFQQGPVSWSLHQLRPSPGDAERDPVTALAQPRIGSAAMRASVRDLKSCEVNGQVQVQESAKLRQHQGTSGAVATDHRPQSRRYSLQSSSEGGERDARECSSHTHHRVPDTTDSHLAAAPTTPLSGVAPLVLTRQLCRPSTSFFLGNTGSGEREGRSLSERSRRRPDAASSLSQRPQRPQSLQRDQYQRPQTSKNLPSRDSSDQSYPRAIWPEIEHLSFC